MSKAAICNQNSTYIFLLRVKSDGLVFQLFLSQISFRIDFFQAILEDRKHVARKATSTMGGISPPSLALLMGDKILSLGTFLMSVYRLC